MSDANGSKTLVEILEVLQRMDGRAERIDGRLANIERDTAELRAEVRLNHAEIRGRLDNLIDLAGERWRDHEERLRRLEERQRT